jgi:hypothetical protein
MKLMERLSWNAEADVMWSRLQVQIGRDMQTSSVMNDMGQWDSSGCTVDWKHVWEGRAAQQEA